MNGVSFLIYLVSVTSSLSLAFAWALFIAIVITVILGFVVLIAIGEKSMTKETIASLSRYLKISIFTVILFTLGVVFTPSRQDMIMIAASEVGEYVIQTEEMQGAVNEVSGLSKDSVTLLREYIKSETEALRAKTAPTEGQTK